MKKIIFILIIILLIIISLVFVLSSRRQENILPIDQNATPNPTQITLQKGLYLINADPADQSQDVSSLYTIILEFSRKPEPREVTVTFTPNIQADFTYDNNTILITPKVPLLPDTTYLYTVTFTATNMKQSYRFRTLKQGESLQDTSVPDVHEEQEKFELENATDVYVAGFTPYEDNNFAIQSDYTFKPEGHYVFFVELKNDRESSQQEFVTWLKAKNLSDTQIEKLDILYR